MRRGTAQRGHAPLGRTAGSTGDDIGRTAEEIAIAALGASRAATRYPLHGAWAVAAWTGGLSRRTRGIDLLDLGRGPVDAIVADLADVLGRHTEGLCLDWSAPGIRTKGERRSPLHRLSISAWLGHRRLRLRIDVTAARYPGLDIEFRPLPPIPGRRTATWAACCTAEELVAEKTALLVTYGADHTRLQDVQDLWLLSKRVRFDGQALADAMAGVFAGRDAARMLERDDGYWESAFDPRRVTPTDRLRWEDLRAGAQWSIPIPAPDMALLDLGRFLVPVLRSLRHESGIPATWLPGGGRRMDGAWASSAPNSGAGATPESLKAAAVITGAYDVVVYDEVTTSRVSAPSASGTTARTG
ncbi:nucleotidyl transferase AbiEii/AbiGii toxin family protein [Pararoseomonas sp. SCSIO 73927]|uniref:nucleotidyl transferase AbiEii/AbiGii toxin family protein n=1 Tax=Pararoseomonas sp. SCSIO 73927 TaxID=3114537 RepID=UPI0030D0944D